MSDIFAAFLRLFFSGLDTLNANSDVEKNVAHPKKLAHVFKRGERFFCARDSDEKRGDKRNGFSRKFFFPPFKANFEKNCLRAKIVETFLCCPFQD
jgi:hypothetical protein